MEASDVSTLVAGEASTLMGVDSTATGVSASVTTADSTPEDASMVELRLALSSVPSGTASSMYRSNGGIALTVTGVSLPEREQVQIP